MAFITPTNNVSLLTGIPINNDYENTLKFASRSAQHTYFASKIKNIGTTLAPVPATWANISYQRYMRESIKLEVNAEKIYDCNYMMFQNTNFGSRWFYAFITNIEYIANEVSEIFYEIDVMQTWFPDCTLRPSFVEREHLQIDGVGLNRVEENIEYGQYYLRNLQPSKISVSNVNYNMMEPSVIVVATDKIPDTIPQSSYWVYGGIGTGLYFWIYEDNINGQTAASALIDNYVAGRFSGCNASDVVAVFQTPKVLWVDYSAQSSGAGGVATYLNYKYSISEYAYTENPRTFNWDMHIPDAIGGYTPRNKKLLQYPYNFLYVTDCRGGSSIYNYEDFVPVTNTQNLRFTYYMQGSCDASMMIVPKDYKGVSGLNYNEKMVYKGYPQNAWSSDLWKAYIAQNGGVIPMVANEIVGPTVDMGASTGFLPQHYLNVEEDMLKAFLGMETVREKERARMGTQGNITNDSVVSRTIGEMGRNIGKRLMGAQAKGNYNGDIIYASKLHDFYYGQMTITAEFAARLDKFFDMYGYKRNEVKIPATNVRKHWTYTKVIGLNMIASIPQDAEEKIKVIFERGIRFWNYPDEVGNFSDALCEDNIAENTRPVTP